MAQRTTVEALALLLLLLGTAGCGSSSVGGGGGDADADSDADADGDADGDADTDTDSDADADSDSDADADADADGDSDTDADSDADTDPPTCGFGGLGTRLEVAPDIAICLPDVVCTAETCPPPLGTCVDGECVFEDGYEGLSTVPEAWATYYCDLAAGGCHGVSQLYFAEETAAHVGEALGLELCGGTTAGATCVGIAASSPMVVGNSEVAIDPDTGTYVEPWGLGMTQASGLCYEVTGPGGTAVVALTDRCAGYCTCGGSAYQECGPCVSADDMSPNCSCIGEVPGLFEECCGVGCSEVQQDCDWCASNNHPHFDLDIEAFNHVCGELASNGSCQLSKAVYVDCIEPEPEWPPND